jgi:hypothetical protein
MTRLGQRENRPRQAIIAVVQASDGLIYEVLACSHRQLIVAPRSGPIRQLEFRRCGRCPKLDASRGKHTATLAPAVDDRLRPVRGPVRWQ